MSKIINKIIIKRLRKIMRGHILLFKNDNLKISNDIKSEIENVSLFKNNKFFSKIFFGTPSANLNDIYIQFLKTNILDRKLNEAIQIYFVDKKKLKYPLTPKLVNIFEKKNIKINKFLSYSKFVIFSFNYFLRGQFFFYYYIINSILSFRLKSNQNYAYFLNTPIQVFNKKKISINSIMFWYMREEKLNHIKNISHDNKSAHHLNYDNFNINYNPNLIPRLKNIYDLFILFFWYLVFSLLAILFLLKGNFSYAILFGESIKYKIFNIINDKQIANFYFFNNSQPIYRPLWTYEAEKRKSKIFFYFYSTNNESVKTTKYYEKNLSWWSRLTWPNYLIWSEIQSEFIKSISNSNHTTQIIGPITDTGDKKIIINSKKKIISIFDIQPFRTSLFYNTVITDHVNMPPNSINFISDIIDVFSRNDEYEFFLKRKRFISNNIHPVYNNFINKLTSTNKLKLYDYNNSIKDILSQSDLVICSPYTSVAHIASSMGRYTFYFDPSGKIDITDKASYGIRIISGKKKLKELFLKDFK